MTRSQHSSSAASETALSDAVVADVCQTVAPVFQGRGGASRNDLLWTATNAWASAETISVLLRLPLTFYGTLADVQHQLEQHGPQ